MDFARTAGPGTISRWFSRAMGGVFRRGLASSRLWVRQTRAVNGGPLTVGGCAPSALRPGSRCDDLGSRFGQRIWRHTGLEQVVTGVGPASSIVVPWQCPGQRDDPSVHPTTRPTDRGARSPIAFLASGLPIRSETFVYRELRGLRDRGWPIVPVTLRTTPSAELPEFADLHKDLVVAYGGSVATRLAQSAVEFVRHPLCSLGTVGLALRDMIAPGEPIRKRTWFKLLPQALNAIALSERMRREGVGHVHCHFAHAPTTFGMYLARQLGVSFSFVGHANDLFERRGLLKRKLERAAFVSCISEWHAALYRQVCPDSAPRLSIIRCGVPLDDWSPRESESESDALTILTVARLVPKKGIDTLIKSLRLLRDRTEVAVTLLIAGDGPETERLRSLAEVEGVAAQVQFLGAVDNAIVPGLLARATVFALPCRVDNHGDRDGIPVVLMEAMACGVPVVTGDLPTIRELVEDGVTGALVDGSRPEQLAERLVELLGDPSRRRKLGQAGMRRVQQEFSLALNLTRLEEQLERTPATVRVGPPEAA